jgi:hypothetical protein
LAEEEKTGFFLPLLFLCLYEKKFIFLENNENIFCKILLAVLLSQITHYQFKRKVKLGRAVS